jgi:tRNA A37 methylthiotransferase MiaB
VINMISEIKKLSALIGPESEMIIGSCLSKTDGKALAEVFNGRTISPTDFSALNDLPGIRIKIEDMEPIFGKDAPFIPPVRRKSSNLIDSVPYSLSHWIARKVPRGFPVERVRTITGKLAKSRRMVIYASAGCSKNCSYCAIRFATGHVRSKPLDVLLRSISEGLRAGYRTFDLLSDSIGGYGLDLGTNLGQLLRGILTHPGKFTIGISDLHPHEFIKYFDEIVSLCRSGRIHYLYVPIQSGNDRILRMMNRACDPIDLLAKFLAVRNFNEVFLQTGIMVGFPGETEAEFADTIRFLKTVDFDNVYVHYYCDMPNTASSTLPGKIDKETMVCRLKRVGDSGIRHNVTQTRNEWERTLKLI